MLPSLFVAHGSPMLAVENSEYAKFLGELPLMFARPRAIALFSAHWESPVQEIGGDEKHGLLYDFYGFPEEMYRIAYPAAGDPALAREIGQCFAAEGIGCRIGHNRGLDHGAWVILKRMYPEANVPVVPLSVNPRLTPEEQYRTGAALSALRELNVLIVASGGTVHNLRKLDWSGRAAPRDWAAAFDRWLDEQMETWNLEALFDYEARAPHAEWAVPTKEHFVPLLIAMGAADTGRRAKLIHRSYQYGSLSLSCWLFG